MRARKAVLLLAAATALPRLAALLYERGRILSAFTDKGDNFAQTFLASGTYGFIPGHPSAYTQPLYGWFLIPIYWIFGRHWEAVGLAHVAVAIGTAILIFEIGRRFLSFGAGVVAALLYAFHPYLIWHDVHMNREILDEFLAAAIVLLTLTAARRFGYGALAFLGAVVGVAILGNVRLEAIPIVLGGFLVWQRGGSRRIWLGLAALVGAAAIVVAPWVIRNQASVGCATITTDARALWKANNSKTLTTLQHGGWIDHVPQPRSFPPTPQDVFVHWQKTGVVLPYDECAQESEFQGKVLHFWLDHPGEKAQLLPLDAKWLWQPSVVETTGRPGAGTWLDTARTTAEPVFMVIVYALAVYGLFLVPRAFAVLAVLLLGYQTLVAMLFVGETRYRVPWDCLLGLLAGTAAVAIYQRVRERVEVRRAAAAAQDGERGDERGAAVRVD